VKKGVKSSQKRQPDVVSLSPFKKGFFFIFSSIPKEVFAVSFFGLFLGMSTTMVYSQMGMFLKTELHITEAAVALVDGIIEFVSFICRILVGVISDYLKDRKFILLFGCTVTLFARSILATATSSFMVTFIQSIERLGNGFQATTRDALIADISHVNDRGKAYGFSRSLKTVGCLLGVPIAILIMHLSHNNYRIVFSCATIPAAIAIICLLKIKTPNIVNNKENRKIENPFQRKYLNSLDEGFWKILLLSFTFEMGHFTESLLPIYASNFLSKTTSGSESMFVSLGQILFSFPVGLYADKFGKIALIRVCMIAMIFANLSFIFIHSTFGIYLGAFIWGGQMSAIQGLFLSIITEKVNTHVKATAIGIYYFTVGVAFLLASIIAGHIWTAFGGKYAFIYSLCVSCFSLSVSKLLLPSAYKNIKCS
jgi:MFS family permease